MKLITTSKILEKEFTRLIQDYNEFYWAVAWASSSSSIFNNLVLNKSKIKKIVVGIHFYQTHPNFIEEFLNDKKVHFIQQPAGTFHPKVYLFYNNKSDWEIIIGSANFTKEAFSRNSEASMLISHNEANDNLLFEIKSLIENAWKEGKVFDANDLKNYRLTWQNQQQKIKSLSGKYGNNEPSKKPIYSIAVAKRTWSQFVRRIRAEGIHTLNQRLFVIGLAQDIFNEYKHFNQIPNEERKFIAGIPNNLDNDGNWLWGVFGSMHGAGIFKNRIIQNDINISKALDKIPSIGNVRKKQFDDFVILFQRAFIGTRLEGANNLATATRLLAMKRPDTFVCFASKNKSALCRDFEIIQSNMDFERYWEEIVLRVNDCHWSIYPDPKNNIERKILSAKAAFLDSLYYVE